MGRVEQDVTYENHNIPRRVSISSFYMDETEISNYHWCEYMYWVRRTYTDYPMVYKKSLPDTLSWREKLGFNEVCRILFKTPCLQRLSCRWSFLATSK